MENKELDNFLEDLSDKARELSDMADWYKDFNSSILSEYHRYAHRVVCDLIDIVRIGCKTFDEVDALLDRLRYCCWNDYKFYQSENFVHFAELAMVKYRVFGEILSNIKIKAEVINE